MPLLRMQFFMHARHTRTYGIAYRWVQMEEANQELLHNMSAVFGAPLRLKDLTSAHLIDATQTHAHMHIQTCTFLHQLVATHSLSRVLTVATS